MLLPTLALLFLVPAGTVGQSLNMCTNDGDCSFTGVCVAGVCKCSAAWTGPHCQHLNLQPAPTSWKQPIAIPPNGNYQWGAAVVHDDVDNKYHVWYTEYVNHCPMTYGTWTVQTQIRHGVSSSPGGPFEPAEVAVPSAAGNPVVARAPDGTWLMLFTNERYSGPQRQCFGPSNNWSAPVYGSTATKCGIHLAYSNHSGGPWRYQYNVLDPSVARLTNPGLYVFRNGTVLVPYKTSAPCPRSSVLCPNGHARAIGMVSAPHWTAWPYSHFPVGGHDSVVGAGATLEDPSNLYEDAEGRLHLLFHQGLGVNGEHYSPPGVAIGYGGAAHSVDGGRTWLYAAPYGTGYALNETHNTLTAYPYTVNYTDGSSLTCIRREEPRLLLGATGQPEVLITQCQVRAIGTTGPNSRYPKWGEMQWETHIVTQPIGPPKGN